jgi:hypothetical protein
MRLHFHGGERANEEVKKGRLAALRGLKQNGGKRGMPA